MFKMDITSFHQPEVLRQALRFGRYVRSQGIQIVHTFDYPLTCFAVPLARIFGVPAVLSSQRGSRYLIPRLYRGLVRATDQLVNGVVVNCRAMETHLVREEDLPRRKVYLCYNGIDTVQYSPATFQKEFPQRRLTVGCLAVLRPEKNLGLLVRAMGQLSKSCSNIRLLIVGDGPRERSSTIWCEDTNSKAGLNFGRYSGMLFQHCGRWTFLYCLPGQKHFQIH